MRYGDDVHTVDDPYRWLPTLGEIDLHLIGEGRHERLWDVLGAHVRTYDTPAGPVTGTSFAVWAPTAQGVRVTGDFDGWAGPDPPDALAGQLRRLGALRARASATGTRYKFQILGQDGVWREKADPHGVRHRGPAGDRVGRRRRCTTSGATTSGWPARARAATRTPSR